MAQDVANKSVSASANMDVEGELSTYSMAVARLNYNSAVDFWVANTAVMSTLASLTLDIIGRLFSVWGSHHWQEKQNEQGPVQACVSEDEQQVLSSTCLYSFCSFC